MKWENEKNTPREYLRSECKSDQEWIEKTELYNDKIDFQIFALDYGICVNQHNYLNWIKKGRKA